MTNSLLVNVDIPIDTKRLKDSMESAKILFVWSPPPWCLVEVPPGQDAGRTPSFGRPLSIAVHREFVASKDFGLGIATKWCLSSIAKLVYNSNFTRIYGRYISGWWGYKPTYNWGVPHCYELLQLKSLSLSGPTKQTRETISLHGKQLKVSQDISTASWQRRTCWVFRSKLINLQL